MDVRTCDSYTHTVFQIIYKAGRFRYNTQDIPRTIYTRGSQPGPHRPPVGDLGWSGGWLGQKSSRGFSEDKHFNEGQNYPNLWPKIIHL